MKRRCGPHLTTRPKVKSENIKGKDLGPNRNLRLNQETPTGRNKWKKPKGPNWNKQVARNEPHKTQNLKKVNDWLWEYNAAAESGSRQHEKMDCHEPICNPLPTQTICSELHLVLKCTSTPTFDSTITWPSINWQNQLFGLLNVVIRKLLITFSNPSNH